MEIGTTSENTGGKINYIWYVLEYFWLWIIENSSINSQKFVTPNMKCKFKNLTILGRCNTLEMAPKNQPLPVFHSLLSGFCPHGYEMVLHLWASISRKEGRGRDHLMKVNILRDLCLLYVIAQNSVTWLPLAARESGGTNHFNLPYCHPEENQSYKYWLDK